MAKLKKLAGQTIIYGASSIVARFLNVFLTPIHTESFPEAAYGQVTQLLAYVALMNIILTFGMETTFFRFLQDGKSSSEVYKTSFTWILFLCTIWGTMMLLFYIPIANITGYEKSPEWILMLSIVILLDALASLPMAKLRQEDKPARFAWINITSIIISVTANVVFILIMGLGITYIFVAFLLASSVKLLLAFWNNFPKGLGWNRELIGPMLTYGGFIMVAGLPGMLNEVLDRILIPDLWPDGKIFQHRALSGAQMNGIYGANYKIAMLILLATQAYRYAAEPFFFKEAKDKQSPRTFARIFHYFVLAAMIASLLLSTFAYEIASFDFLGIPELLGKKDWTFIDRPYWIGLTVVPVLTMAYVLQGAYLNMSFWFKITKQTHFALLFSGSGALVTIIINVWGIPVYGYLASAWATFCSYGLMCILVYFSGQKYYPIPYRLARLVLYASILLLTYFFIFHSISIFEVVPVFWQKLTIIFISLGIVALIEYRFPISWNPK